MGGSPRPLTSSSLKLRREQRLQLSESKLFVRSLFRSSSSSKEDFTFSSSAASTKSGCRYDKYDENSSFDCSHSDLHLRSYSECSPIREAAAVTSVCHGSHHD